MEKCRGGSQGVQEQEWESPLAIAPGLEENKLRATLRNSALFLGGKEVVSVL